MKQDLFVTVEDESLLPIYATEESAGADLRANITEDITIAPGKIGLIPTGIKMEIPRGYEIQLRPRSGLALKHQISLMNSPATIDSDYRGEIKIILVNHSDIPFVVSPKMRIAQMVLAPIVQANFIIKEELATSVRGEGGFGHSGTN